MNKPFSPSLHSDNDIKARDIAIKWLAGRGHHALNNKDIYGVDLYVPMIARFDVEIKVNWTGPFSFDTVHIPERKGKFSKLPAITFFMVISGDGKRAMIIDGRDLKKEFLVEVPNKYVASGEKFYAVPKNLAREVEL